MYLFIIILILASLINSILCYSLPTPPITTHNGLYFKGGGIFFWWQSGFGKYLNENCNNEYNNIPLIGASAGSLTAALLACNIDFNDSLDFVLKQAENERLYERKTLFLIWGKLIENWLDYLLPDELPLQAQKNLYIALTPLNVLRTGSRVELVSNFNTKSDLKSALLASCHIPLFLNGKVYTKYKGHRYVDGSLWTFLSNDDERIRPLPTSLADMDVTYNDESIYKCDYTDDEEFQQIRNNMNFVSMATPNGLKEMMTCGYNYAKRQHESGLLFPSTTTTTSINLTNPTSSD